MLMGSVMDNSEKYTEAIRVAKMYYYHNMTTAAIALELNVSRSTVSRLLTYARDEGLVDIRIVDPREQPQQYEKLIDNEFKVERTHVVQVSEIVGESEWLERVAQYTANYLNAIFNSDMILGVAWGTTASRISRHLAPKVTHNTQIVQLNGAGNMETMGIEYASQIIMRFAQNYQSSAHLFPVPAFFDKASTKKALWEEGSVRRLLDLQEKADLLLYSIGAVNAGIPSHIHVGGYLKKKDYTELANEGIAGDIATVFFREDGSYKGIPINERSSGPNLSLFQQKHGICVVSGLAKVKGLYAALKGGFIRELIIDEPTARRLVENYVVS
jgi:DNA-binding transcriptional regulator LsrR (DeoR family)